MTDTADDTVEEVAESTEDKALIADGVDESTDLDASNSNVDGDGEDVAPKTFPQKLMEILSNEDYTELISWLPHGNGFLIHKKKTFASDVLPIHFKASKFTSFTRKLNRWGFSRAPRGPETGAYFHKLFCRDKPDLCLQMTSNSGNKYQTTPMQQQLLPTMGAPHMPYFMPPMMMVPPEQGGGHLPPQQAHALWQQQMQLFHMQQMQMMNYQQHQHMLQQQQQQQQQHDGRPPHVPMVMQQQQPLPQPPLEATGQAPPKMEESTPDTQEVEGAQENTLDAGSGNLDGVDV